MVANHPNYHQLLYFWAVVREGGVVKAAQALHVTPQTVSGALRLLEAQIPDKLLIRVGRGLEPTELGRTVFRYAEEIFARGLELGELVRTGAARVPLPLVVGIAAGVSHATACASLAPALEAGLASRLLCRHGTVEELLGELDAHRMDLVLAPGALPSASSLRGSSRLLAESDISFFAAPSVARRLKGRFPANLDGAAWLLPAAGTAVRRALDAWLARRGIAPSVVAEFESTNLINDFGGRGLGVFCAPADAERDIVRQHAVRIVGRTSEIRARTYAIALERRMPHPAVAHVMGEAESPGRPAASA